MRKILITGVNGLIGSAIAELLLSKNEVIGTSIEKNNQTGLDFQYIQSNITDNKTLQNLPKPIDIIVHCAAIITGDDFSNALINTNCIGIQNTASYAINANCKNLIFLSSLPIIGKPSIVPITETHPINPPTIYHITKYFGELALQNLLGKDRVIVFRIPSPIGRKTAPNKIVPVFVKNAIENIDFNILGQGKRIQNYIDVRDIARAVECAIEQESSGIFNIASEHSYSNKELAELCINLFNSSSKINYAGEDKEEDFQWIVSTDKAKRELGFTAKYSIEETLMDISKNFKK